MSWIPQALLFFSPSTRIMPQPKKLRKSSYRFSSYILHLHWEKASNLTKHVSTSLESGNYSARKNIFSYQHYYIHTLFALYKTITSSYVPLKGRGCLNEVLRDCTVYGPWRIWARKIIFSMYTCVISSIAAPAGIGQLYWRCIKGRSSYLYILYPAIYC